MAFVLLSQKKLQGETTCSVCLDFFTAPVTLDCGHNLCQGCLEQCWGVPGTTQTPTTCPQCRRRVRWRHQKPNWQLGNLAGLAKEATKVEEKKHRGGEEGAAMCQSHPLEPLLEIFCQEDQVPLCLACLRAHRGHQIIPLQEAAQEAKEKIFCCMEDLMKKREEISTLEICTQNESEQLLQKTKTAKQRSADQLKQLRHFLRKLERQLQDQAAEVEKEIVTRRDEKLGKLSEERASLDNIISELAEKSQQTESKLVQDVGTVLQRCENTVIATDLLTFPVELKWRNWDLFDFIPFLENVTTKFKDTLISGLHLKKANITLDPNTANPQLVLSEDLKGAYAGEETQDLPHHPDRFDTLPCVLGRETFTTGRHFWDVHVGGEGDWFVGVARQSVRRKGANDASECTPEAGIWDVGKWGRTYCSAYSFLNPLPRGAVLKRIRVCLNCTGEQLTFHDADTGTLLCAYSEVPFSEDTFLPYFSLAGKAHMAVPP